jgi:hypothetical protein
MAWPDVNAKLNQFSVHVLTGPFATRRPVPIEDLADAVTKAVLDMFEFRLLGDEQVARHVGVDVVEHRCARGPAAAPKLVSVDALLIEDLTSGEDESFAAALSS